MIKRIFSLLSYDIWRFELEKLPRLKRTFLQILRVIALSFQDFYRDQCSLRASALTFFSLLSIVPTAAVAFGVAKGFGLDNRLEALLYEQLAGQETVAQRIVEFSQALLDNTRGGLIAGVGVLILLWSVLKLLGHIEQSFNVIWQAARGRTLIRKFGDYTAIMFVCPILLLVASSATVLIAGSVRQLVDNVDFLAHLGPAIILLLRLLPFVTIWTLFTFVYLILPNTKVHFTAAITGGIIAGSAYQLLQALLVNAQIGVSQYNAIYGSFAALPLFLLWLQLSWMIVLYGAEFAYAFQHSKAFEFKLVYQKTSLQLQCLMALRIVHYCIEKFIQVAPAPGETQIAQALRTPPYVITDLTERLVKASVLSRVKHRNKVGYQPAYDPEKLSVHSVIKALIEDGSSDLPSLNSEEFNKWRNIIEQLSKELQESTANRLLKSI